MLRIYDIDVRVTLLNLLINIKKKDVVAEKKGMSKDVNILLTTD